jgi:hypothetical protein
MLSRGHIDESVTFRCGYLTSEAYANTLPKTATKSLKA